MNLDYLTTLVVVIFGVLYPLYGAISGKRTKQMMLAHPEKKITVYREVIAMQMAMGFGLAVVMYLTDARLDTFGLAFIRQAEWVLALLGGCLLLLYGFNQLKISEATATAYQEVSYLLPSTKQEYQWVIVTSFVAGTVEEILFRSFVFVYFLNYLPAIGAVLLCNILFALGHFGTGMKNMINTFLLGLFWSLSFYLTGSLWLAIFTHILLDLYASTVGYRLTLKQP